MALRMSTLFARTLKEDPVDAEVASHRLLHRGSYIRRAAPGIYTWLPLGLEVLRRIENIVRQEMVTAGSQEVHFPALLPAGPYEASGRWETYGDGIFRLKDRKEADYLLAPTHEELFTLLVKDLYSSYKDLPLSIFQIQTKYRDEARPRAGLLRGREFIMKDAYSFDIDDAGLDESYQIMRDAYIRIYERLGLPYVIVEATSGAMGGSGTEEFLYPSEVGEDTYVRTTGGYAANVEAVTTLVGEPLDASDAPAAHKETTPEANTIASLVDVSNELFARADRPWEAADMMKLVMCTLVHPDGQREVIAIGLPGDREVDLDRAAGSGMLSSGEIDLEPASAEDLAKHPDIVVGYIGPGTSLEDQVLGAEGSSGVRFFVDPRITREGSRWVAGGNEAGTHVYDLILGRDFTVDGVLEVAKVHEGDPAPDGSGPLELARGVEIGQIFKLGTRYAEALDLKVLDENGKAQVVTMGSYGVGVTRAMACIAEENHDDKGLIWPQHLAPADVHIVATGKGAEPLEAAEKITAELESMGVRVLLDDRPKASPGVKFGDAELLGVPTILVVGRGLADGRLELRDRRTGEATDVPVEDAVARTVEAVDAKYQELGAKRGEL